MRHKNRRRGITVVYALLLLTVMAGFCSLGADYGRVQLVKLELVRAADAAARAAAGQLANGVTAAQNAATSLGAYNLADGVAVEIDATRDVEFGTWDSGAKTFTVLVGSARSSANAVRVTARRTTASGNPVSLIYASLIGRPTCDVSASAISMASSTTTGYGFVGISSVTMSGNSDTDSYNSNAGAYNRYAAGNKGNIASNGSITLSGRSEVNGDVRAGPGAGLSIGRNVNVSGSTANLTNAVSYPAVNATPYASSNNNSSISSSYLRNGDFTLNSNQNTTLSTGTYYFNDFVVNGNSTLSISGQVTIYITGRLAMSGNTNTNQNKPGNFKIRVASSENVTLSGNADLFADLYAPQSAITVSGNGDLYGSAVGQSLRITGNGSLHVDESLTGSVGSTAIVTTVK